MKFCLERRKRAFTLAEVLITLGVIGVVAALTLPSVISMYKKVVVVNKLRSLVSLYAEAVKLAEAKHGFTDDWPVCDDVTTQAECSKYFFENYLKPELHVIKVCNTKNFSSCWKRPTTISGDNAAINDPNQVAAILSNGSSLHMWTGGQTATNPHWQIAIDIDGPQKGSSTLGKDVFCIILHYKDNISRTQNIRKGISIVGSEYLDLSVLRLDSRYGCNKSVTGVYAGRYCGAYIQAMGWKIPDDYPVKF